jgi:hypothetical protein
LRRPRRLATAMENPKETGSFRLGSFGSALAALGARMKPDDAAIAVRRGATALVKALENQKEGDPIRIKPLASGLANLVGRMNPNRTMVSSPDRMTIRRFYDIESEGLGYGATFFLPCWLPNRSGAAVKKQVRQFVAALEDPFDPREIKSWVWPFTVRWVCTVIQSAGHGSESHEKHHQS